MMIVETPEDDGDRPDSAPKPKNLTPEAQRALAEAETRRKTKRDQEDGRSSKPKEVGGRQGPEPVRYGDWENKGRASDF